MKDDYTCWSCGEKAYGKIVFRAKRGKKYGYVCLNCILSQQSDEFKEKYGVKDTASIRVELS